MPPPTSNTGKIVALMALSFVVLALALFVFIKRSPPRGATDPDIATPVLANVNYEKSPEWSDAIPSLYQATKLSAKEGVALMLQSAVHVRTYAAIQLQRAARLVGDEGSAIYNAKLGDPVLEAAITRQIADTVSQRTDSHGSITSVDYPMTQQPYPFTAIMALRSNTEAYASLVFELSQGSGFTAERVKDKYGVSPETMVDPESFSLLTYPIVTGDYFAKIVFKVDAGDEEVRTVTVTMQRRVK
jgi:hypothetical protein